ncbi:uncharacterized protein LOC135344708 isoform X2 [Halichondria panicea]|uniref:uncharacterized protein LOC135344708 isoform X2 n=1 Tax=Halichondria panicea TaxID=6063 RepID=UPI00312B57C0
MNIHQVYHLSCNNYLFCNGLVLTEEAAGSTEAQPNEREVSQSLQEGEVKEAEDRLDRKHEDVHVGASVTSREKVVPLYDVARPGNMSQKRNTADTDDTLLSGDEGLDTNGVLTEEATDSTAQAKDEPTEDGGDSSGYEAKIATQANQKNFTALDLVKRMQRYRVLKNTSQGKIRTKIYRILMYLGGTYEICC